MLGCVHWWFGSIEQYGSILGCFVVVGWLNSYSKCFRRWRARISEESLSIIQCPLLPRPWFMQFASIICLFWFPLLWGGFRLQWQARISCPEYTWCYLDHLGLEKDLQILRRDVCYREDLALEILETLIGAMLDLQVLLSHFENEFNHRFLNIIQIFYSYTSH